LRIFKEEGGRKLKRDLDLEKQLFKLFTKSKMESLFPGEWKSILKGSGYEFFDLRKYTPGDPLRKVHWKQTAKTGELYVKEKLTESYASVMMLHDISKSTAFGEKEDMQAIITASLAYSALKGNNTCGMIMFSDKVDSYIPPRSGALQLKTIINVLQETRLKECEDTSITEALQTLVNNVPRSLSFIISDFNARKDYMNILGQIDQTHHDIISLIIADQSELDLPEGGCVLELTDLEKGGSFTLDAQTYKLYHEEMLKEKKQIKNMLKAYGSDAEIIVTNGSFIKQISNLLRKRKDQKR
jgi:uncharacterized protein (DUF58 family)